MGFDLKNLKLSLAGLTTSIACTVVSLMADAAFAHTTYFGNRDAAEGIALWFDHPETDPFGAGPGISYDPSRVERVEGFDNLGGDSLIEVVDRGIGISVIPDDDLATLVASVDTGFIIITPDGERLDLTKAEAEAQGQEFVASFRAFQSAKGIYDWNDFIAQPFDLPLEIISLQDPFSLLAGNDLPVQILLEGQPVTGALVEYGGEEFITDSDGFTSVPFNLNQFRTVEASFVVPLENDPNADELNYSTTLTVQEFDLTAQSVPEPFTLVGIVVIGLLLPVSQCWRSQII